ncbi:MAG: type II secretion system F family protein [Clostridia bacterium]|nr:type II secretion system F family protein [Clostridia bacterium]
MQKRNKNTVPANELSTFCTQVALMLNAGMALYNGMEALAETYADTERAEMYKTLSDAVTETGSLAAALRRDDRWPSYLAEMCEIGERTGRLEEAMNGLAAYYEREGRIRRAVASAVTYPLVLGVMMLGIVLILILKVLPLFRRVLTGMGLGVDGAGVTMMNAGSAIGWAVLVIVAVLLICALGIVILLKTKARGKVLDLLNRVFPPMKKINRRINAARVSSVLSMMLGGGFPLEEALALVPNILTDGEAAGKVRTMADKLRDGGSFGAALSESELFDQLYDRMIRMGITAGREDTVMAKVASICEEQAEEDISALVSVIEPTLVAMLSIVIGAILLSVMLPMAGIIASIV